jgi:5-methylcytosine-specific restriction endonuclease McrA
MGKEYYKNRRAERRKRFLQLLGGKCESCGTTEKLHFDHKSKKNKEFQISDMIDTNEARLLKEVKKCQLLCNDCHRAKTHKNWEYALPESPHGSLWRYKKYGCRCDKCKKYMSDYYYSKKNNEIKS